MKVSPSFLNVSWRCVYCQFGVQALGEFHQFKFGPAMEVNSCTYSETVSQYRLGNNLHIGIHTECVSWDTMLIGLKAERMSVYTLTHTRCDLVATHEQYNTASRFSLPTLYSSDNPLPLCRSPIQRIC